MTVGARVRRMAVRRAIMRALFTPSVARRHAAVTGRGASAAAPAATVTWRRRAGVTRGGFLRCFGPLVIAAAIPRVIGAVPLFAFRIVVMAFFAFAWFLAVLPRGRIL